jgi:hypothetical protein
MLIFISYKWLYFLVNSVSGGNAQNSSWNPARDIEFYTLFSAMLEYENMLNTYIKYCHFLVL